MNNLENINKIFHISDIHIKLYKGRRLYLKLLLELLKTILQLKDLKSIAVVTGDIFHSKTDMSPLSIRMGGLYLSGLANLLPTIVIAGNHDANLANKHRLDSLSPIVDLVLSKYLLIYLKLTGWHKYRNLNFWLASIYDLTLPKKKSLYPKLGINIGLYHGIVGNIQANGVFLKPKFLTSLFKHFDYVLLGDIHKRQILSKKPLIGYAGSLTQLNYGLLVKNHGILVWDLYNNSVLLVDIENDYAFHNIVVLNGQIVSMPTIKSKHTRIKLKYSNTTFNRLKLIQEELKLKYQVLLIVLVRTPSKLLALSSIFLYNLNNINDVAYQKSIIKLYILHAGFNFKPKLILSIIALNLLINNKLSKNKANLLLQQNIWSILKLLFSNFFSYGLNNIIDFTTKRGIVGILGLNRSGKSSLIDIIIFMLYDRTSRTTKTLSILNNTKDRLYGKITLSINGTAYIILKEGVLKVNKKSGLGYIPIKTKFYMIDPQTLLIVDLTGTLRLDTNRIIQQYIGTMTDARATFISTQGDSNKFLLMSNTDRKTQLNSLLNLDLFDNCYYSANDSSKLYKIKLLLIDIVRVLNEIDLKKTTRKQIKKRLVLLLRLIKLKLVKAKDIGLRLREALSSLSLLYESSRSLLLIETDIVINERQIKTLGLFLQLVKTLKKEISLSRLLLLKIALAFNIELLQGLYEAGLPTIQRFKDNIDNLKILLIKRKQLLQKHKLFEAVLYDLNCPYCMNNPLTKDAMTAEENLKSVLKLILQTVKDNSSMLDLILVLKRVKEDIDSYLKEVVPMLNSIYKNLTAIELKVLMALKDLLKLNNKTLALTKLKQEFIKNEKVIELNIRHRETISLLTREELKINSLIKNLLKETLLSNITLGTSNLNIRFNEELRLKYYNLDSILNITLKYKMIMGRLGLQYYITSNIVTILLKTMNLVLLMLTDFTVLFVLLGKTVDINIIYPDKFYPVLTCSGFLKFAISIALRNALSTITNKSKGKMFIIDLGFGVLDALNVTAFNRIIEYISYKYLTLLIVSHLDAMKGMIEEQINIEYTKGVSHITA